jgi:hypothetical protein
MPNTHTRSRMRATCALAILLLACVGLVACGGSSSTTSTSANAASTGTATNGTSTGGASSTATTSTGASSTNAGAPTGPAGRGSARFTAMRECLQKNGITLPTRAPGRHRPGAGGFLGTNGGPTLPKGVTRAQYEAALKKCGGARFGGGGFGRANNPAFRAALTKFAACLRDNGVNVPPPNTTGKGPIFDTKGIDTSSAQFRTAEMKCRSTLVSAFRRPAGGSGAPGAGAPPPGGESSG